MEQLRPWNDRLGDVGELMFRSLRFFEARYMALSLPID
jgi:hypothetical protein